jgi:hypothetical protein
MAARSLWTHIDAHAGSPRPPVTVLIRFPHSSRNLEWTALARHELINPTSGVVPANRWSP